MAADKQHIAIVGGGFTGAAVAIHLAQFHNPQWRITLLEPRDNPGAGVAYSTRHPVHRINVPAARMQLAGRPDGDFDRWYRQQSAFARDPAALRPDGAVYPQRGQFGEYVSQQFAAAQASSGGTLAHLRQRATGWDNGVIITEDGTRITADLVILAASHPPPALPADLAPVAGYPALIANPWAGDLSRIPPDARVTIMGTGLTMADVAAALAGAGHRGPVLAFSRHGLLSQPNASATGEPWTGDYARGSLRQQLQRIRQDVRRAAGRNLAWQSVLDTVRQQGQQFWQQLSPADRQRFLRHVRRYWDIHRYRIAPQVADALDTLRERDILQIAAARLIRVAPQRAGLALTLQPRHGAETTRLTDYLILTTGPDHRRLIPSQPFLAALAHQGVIRADPLGLGLDVDDGSRAISRSGISQPRLLVAGPAARGQFGELMGLPQVADHAAQLARQASEILGCRAPSPTR
ncbi:FAD-dependent oxidoreductase [Shimwellia pseudoproteus]|uniref:FAD/NAD(P)-binding protein n=1 Tax=Shimwellia pseudoproteus TaxID=570012 RepID=UPI0018EA3B5F|nr:FAD-dependent oxidoreductase [Shimwellia pseudoproteus]MBJ3816109.1 FAD-dependent oxidoreductase [Shimwellia pseudoproteus]